MTRMIKFEDVLAYCLELLERGESIEQILAQYPQQADELRSLLHVSSLLQKRRLEPSVGAQQASLAHFLDTAVSMRQQKPSSRGWHWRGLFSGVLATGLAAFLLLFAVFGVAQNALPGDTLYGAKLYGEQVQMEWAGDVDSRLQLKEALTKRRQEEIRALLDAGREEQVRFTGEVESIAGTVWQIDGLSVEIPPAMADSGQVGMVVTIIGHTAVSGVVQADEVLILSALPTPSPTPQPSPTLLPSPTATPIPPATTATPTLSPTVSPTFSPTPEATATLLPSPTALVTSPAVQPTRDDSDDDSSDDSDDSSDDSDDSSDDSDDSSDDSDDDSSDDSGDDSSDDSDDDSSDDSDDDSSDDSDDDSSDDSDDDSSDDSDDDGSGDSDDTDNESTDDDS